MTVSYGGKSASVGSFYQAFVGLDGAVRGKAVIGVNSSGVFTGMQVVGGSNISKLTFRGNVIQFQNAAGTNQLVYDSGTWKFFGKVYAQELEGDVTDTFTFGSNNTLKYSPGKGIRKKFRVKREPFDKVMVFTAASVYPANGSGEAFLSHGGGRTSRLPFTNHIPYLSVRIPAGTGNYDVDYVISPTGNSSGTINGGLLIQVFKVGTSVSAV